MKQSFSYKIALLILRLMGIKKSFSQMPVDFKKIRKQDVHTPKGGYFNKNSTSFPLLETKVTELSPTSAENKLVIFIHGGAFISGPAKHHWDAVRTIADSSKSVVWMCDYPKAPEKDIEVISANIDHVYQTALKKYPNHQISLVGDSAGATLITALAQRLIKHKERLPDQLILISPVMDASMTNPEIDIIDPLDPMLSKKGILSAKQMCAGNLDLTDPMISPLYGEFAGFPKTLIFLGSYDIMFPDEQLAVQKLKDAKVDVHVVEGEKMPHIWPILPVMKEAKLAFKEILNRL
ncbi:MAG: alpha/beta hydrolase fold domain-containing protein [Crocinitomicaceae bacterium]